MTVKAINFGCTTTMEIWFRLNFKNLLYFLNPLRLKLWKILATGLNTCILLLLITQSVFITTGQILSTGLNTCILLLLITH